MATNDSIKKQQTPGKTEVKKTVANSPKKGFMSIPEVRMLFYVLPVALVFATFTYLNSRGNSLLYSLLIPTVIGLILFGIVFLLLRKNK